MNKVLIGLLLVAVAGGALWALGVFDPAETQEPGPGGVRKEGTPSPGGPELRPGELGAREVPKDQPRPEWFPVTEPLRVLFVVKRVNSWLALQAGVLGGNEDAKIESSVWAADPGPEPVPLPKATWIREQPNGQWFDQQDFHVLVVAQVDPAVLPDDFWQAVTKRVTGGLTGLWVQPSMPPSAPGSGVNAPVHPMLTHPLFAPLVPVADAARLEGGRGEPGKPAPLPPGIYKTPVPFVVTDAGTKHPASRIVPWSEWSRRIWVEGGSGLQPWGSWFCYPVTKIAPTAVTLVNASPPTGAEIPMFIARSGAGGRVLWFGAEDASDATYRVNTSIEKWNTILHNSIVWLAGRAPAEEK